MVLVVLEALVDLEALVGQMDQRCLLDQEILDVSCNYDFILYEKILVRV